MFIALSALTAGAQDLSSLREKSIVLIDGKATLDTLLIDPSSVTVKNHDTSDFTVNASSKEIRWKTAPYPADTIHVSYRVLLPNLEKTVFRKPTKLLSSSYDKNPFDYIPQNDRYLEKESEDIKTLGNISRGVGFGNRQDVTVNSNLNLRLSGRIQDQVDILAAISDENNPIQPEGNTQQIQDFDRVFIQLSKDSTRVLAGDFPMITPDSSYFMVYNKKSRGLHLEHMMKTEKGKWDFSGEGAVSRGRFSRNTITGIEGNQGPYRLTGANGETFIIVISGTEKVYLDGELLTRGEQNDYTINYNSGEVVFMPKRLITQYSRIVIEFQYSDRNYARSVIRFGTAYSQDKWRVRANYFNEQDNKNQPFQQNLDDSVGNISTRQFIANAGDADVVFAPRKTPISEDDINQISYVEIDSGGNTFLRQATPEDTTERFRVSFSYVGPGNGDYNQKLTTANGKVFEFVGIGLGEYAPVEVLVPPKRMQMLNVGFDYKFSDATSASIEFVRTNNDINTLSNLDKNNDVGYGLKFGASAEKKLSQDSLAPWLLRSDVSYEFVQRDFRFVERYRDVEFDRLWNRTLNNQNDADRIYLDEQIAGLGFELSKGRNLLLRARESFYGRGPNQSGLSQQYLGKFQRKRFVFRTSYDDVRSNLTITGDSTTNRYYNLTSSAFWNSSWVNTTLSYTREQSGFYLPEDSVASGSYGFERTSLRFTNGDSLNLTYGLELNRRVDEQGKEGSFSPTTDGRDVAVNFGWRQSRNADFKLTTTYRSLIFLDTSLQTDDLENTLQGRFETRLNFLKRMITTQAYYQLGTGQEQRREFSYLEVGDGNGNYIWNDYDSNGIQSLNEFELASSFDVGRANFVRQFLPVQGFIRSYSSEFNQSIRVQPAALLAKSKKAHWKFVRRFSNVSTFKVQKKVTNQGEDFVNPFVLDVADTSLLTTNSLLRSVLSFNQSSPVFGLDYQFSTNQNKVLLINGVDSRNNREDKLRVRINLKRNYEILLEGRTGRKEYTSQFLTDRAYSYTFESIRPRLGYQYKSSYRFEVYFDYFEARNLAEFGGEKTFNRDVTAEFRWNILNRGTIRLNAGLVDVNYKGNDNSPVAYELLAGLRNGRNVKWQLQIEQRFAKNIQVLVNYDGRQSIDNPVIHIGRIQARYLF